MIQLARICILLSFLAPIYAASAAEGVLRAGFVGCDTSHVIAFAHAINDPSATGSLAQVEVTAAYPGGSPDLPTSRDRLPGFVEDLRNRGITIVDSLDELVDQCDVLLLTSVDGRAHLWQFKAIAKGKPVFIDKPAAASLADVLAIFYIAEATRTPVFTASSLRYIDPVRELAEAENIGDILGCETVGPLKIEPHHPDLFWYGIHGVEPLFTIMGLGCETVTRIDTDLASLVVGKWSDGRIGSYRGSKQGASTYSFSVYGTKGSEYRADTAGYEPALRAICDFFLSRKPPVSREETIEIFAFMEAADESKRRGGEPVTIAEIIARAEGDVASRQSEAGSASP